MRTLTINKSLLNIEKRSIGKYSATIGNVNENGDIIVTVICEQIHNLSSQGSLTLIPNDRPFDKNYKYEILDPFSFVVYIPEFVMVKVNNYANVKHNAILEPVDDYFSAYAADTSKITIRYMGEIIKGGVNIEYDEDGTPLNEEDAAARVASCDKPVNFSGRGYVDVKNDWFIKDGAFNTGIIFQEDVYAMEVGVPLEINGEYRRSDSQQILNEYVEIFKDSILPEIIDNEKQRFIPVYYDEKGNVKQVKEIVINLHFRDRKNTDLNDGSLRDGWKTSDSQLWNGISLQNGVLRYDTKGIDDSYADTLDYLGFTENDIKFSKNKLKKSFIRMTYYPTKNMTQKVALAFSTVFIDSGEMYCKYNKISGKQMTTFDEKRLDKDLRISASFKILNNRQNNKSSEGFYLYFYPNIFEGENLQTTIYMKVEFNHAGYGKTVPMMLPRSKNGNVLKTQDKEFPLNFTPVVYDDNGNEGVDFDFEGYQNAILIPIELGYDSQLGKYIYTFPFATPKNGCVELNLFEPKINGEV